MMLLALELKKSNFEVIFACNRTYALDAIKLGLNCIYLTSQSECSPNSSQALVWDHQKSFKNTLSWDTSWSTLITKNHAELLRIVNRGDLLIASTNLLISDLVATQQQARWVEVGLNPCSFLTSDMNSKKLDSDRWSDGLNKVRKIIFNAAKIEEALQKPELRLHAVPKDFCDQTFGYSQCIPTGFWLSPASDQQDNHKKQKTNFNRSFQYERIVLSVSSQLIEEPITFIQQHLAIAKLINLPLVVADTKTFSACNSEDKLLKWISEESMELYLNPQTIYFNHGGMGSIASGFRSNATMMIEPFSGEQLMNAYLCLRKGLAHIINREKFDPQAIANIIQFKEAQIQRGTISNAHITPHWFSGIPFSRQIIENLLTPR